MALLIANRINEQLVTKQKHHYACKVLEKLNNKAVVQRIAVRHSKDTFEQQLGIDLNRVVRKPHRKRFIMPHLSSFRIIESLQAFVDREPIIFDL